MKRVLVPMLLALLFCGKAKAQYNVDRLITSGEVAQVVAEMAEAGELAPDGEAAAEAGAAVQV